MSESNAFPETPTARGDRDGRRRDVLTAATAILEEAGWEGFSIRGVASRAGVSTGAVYQWFSGKDEIFGELFDREVQQGIDMLEDFPTDIGLDDTINMMMRWVVDLYERLGRYELEFTEASSGRQGREIAPSMNSRYLELGKHADELFDRAAANDGVELLQHEHRIIWFWAGCIGVGERLAVSANDFPPARREELLEFCAQRLAKSLLA